MTLRAIVFLTLSALLLTSCSFDITPQITSDTTFEATSDAALVSDGTLMICDVRNVAVLGYPPAMTSGSPLRHSTPALETLLRLDADGNILPCLAVAWQSNHEEKTITLNLREGVTFHDGTPFHAEAVKWNLERQQAANATGFSHLASIEVAEEYTVILHLTQWDNTLLPSLCQAQGLMISPDACQKNGVEWASTHPVGTGPFRFQNIASDGTISYLRYENYWQSGKPYLDEIKIVCDDDTSSREYRFREGRYNVLIRGDTASLSGFSAEGYQINAITSTGPWGMVFDSAKSTSPFADQRVRQAVCYAIDTDYIIHNIYLDTVTKTNQYATPGMYTYNSKVIGYEYNLSMARTLLREAGYSEGFVTTYTYDQSADNADALAHALQDMLAQVQITLILNPVSNSTSTYMQLDGGGWDGIMGTFGSAQYDTLTQFYNYMHGDKKYTSMYKPEELSRKLLYAVTSEEEESLQAILDIQKLLIDDYCLCYYLFSNSDYTVLDSRIHDSGFSSTMPVTVWTPADVWIEN